MSETRIMSLTKHRDVIMQDVAAALAGRLSPADLCRLIGASQEKRSPDGWLRAVIESETWHEELANLGAA